MESADLAEHEPIMVTHKRPDLDAVVEARSTLVPKLNSGTDCLFRSEQLEVVR